MNDTPALARIVTDKPVFRIEVSRHDAIDQRAVDTAWQMGINQLTTCQKTALYFLAGELSEAAIEQIGRELLTDPVTETFSISEADQWQTNNDDFNHTIEVTPLPGVTDPAAENLLRAAHLLGIEGLEQAATGARYRLQGTLNPEALKLLATGVLSNPVIQQFSIDAPIQAPFVPFQQTDDTVDIIPVREQDEKGLMQISAERRLALDLAEMQAIQRYFEAEQRDPTDVELEMLAQTWSEHCVHKTFKALIEYSGPEGDVTIDGLLKTYIRAATETVNKPWVRSAFVDNAGIIAFDDHYDLAFKVETHNHPSALEPFGGANTGLGGVIRDVLGVSAKPIASTDVLCFGPPDLPESELPEGVLHPRRIADGVIHGIEDYGNKMGIPTVNGAILYHPSYTSNPLVFCGSLGLLPRDSHPVGPQEGDLIVVIGGRTGRDGLRGATFSSMEMDQTTGQIAGSAVQIGHPIHEKQVQEVILKARDARLYHAITDCGAGGLSSAVGEMAAKTGGRVQLADVPLKYPGLRPWEIWLSEAQERMVLAVPSENWDAFEAICAGQDVEAVAIGTFEATGRLALFYDATLVGDLDVDFLHDGIPQRRLKAEWKAPQSQSTEDGSKPSSTNDLTETLLKLLAHPNIRSKEAVIRRYDHEVQGGTAVKPLVGVANHGPSDAAVIVPMASLPLTLNPSPTRGEGLESQNQTERIYVPPDLEKKMREIAQHLRKASTPSEKLLWEALRSRKLDNRKFRRQQPIGAFVLDFFCASEKLAVEIDGPIHETQQEADQLRQEILESLGIRFVRVTDQAVEQDLPQVLEHIRAAFTPSPLVGEGAGGEGKQPTRAVAISNGICPLYGEIDPYAMAWAAVDEAIRNLVAVGADPDQIAILDNFCWGNPTLPDRLGALVRCAQGCHDAAVAYGVPFISGKDSLNNEYTGSDGRKHAIPGTLLISAVGIVPDVNKTVTMDLKTPGNLLYVIGETQDEMGGSHYNLINGINGRKVPQPNRKALEIYRALHKAIQAGLVVSCHDVSEGGVAVALAEMCIGGRIGFEGSLDPLGVYFDATKQPELALFAESVGRFIVEIQPSAVEAFEELMSAVLCVPFGDVTTDTELNIVWETPESNNPQALQISVNELERAWRDEVSTQPVVSLQTPSIEPKVSSQRNVNGRISTPKVLILHANGSNRDHDAFIACEMAGGAPEIVHVNQLISGERNLLDYHMMIVPGGFSYGDDLGAGALWALDLRHRLGEDARQFIAEGRPVMGICNGFQALVKAGWLPGDWTKQEESAIRDVTLTFNESGHFECRWVYLTANPNSPCLFTEGLDEPIYCPVAHGEGRIAVQDATTLDALWGAGLAALTYVDADENPAGYPANPNGSVYNIAGLCNAAGNVFGLMPHPEDHIFGWQHPRWRRGERGMNGLRLFQNGVKYA